MKVKSSSTPALDALNKLRKTLYVLKRHLGIYKWYILIEIVRFLGFIKADSFGDWIGETSGLNDGLREILRQYKLAELTGQPNPYTRSNSENLTLSEGV